MRPEAVSLDGKETMRYMVRFASGKHSAIGFYDIPARKDGSLVESRSQLGTPQSAGCIRQWITDAKALWEFAKVGTPVVVTA
jgi:lipoprotein-anchoring transpeptidase ErfK/SrfK